MVHSACVNCFCIGYGQFPANTLPTPSRDSDNGRNSKAAREVEPAALERARWPCPHAGYRGSYFGRSCGGTKRWIPVPLTSRATAHVIGWYGKAGPLPLRDFIVSCSRSPSAVDGLGSNAERTSTSRASPVLAMSHRCFLGF